VKTSLDSVTSNFFFPFKKLLQPLISKMHVLRIVAEYYRVYSGDMLLLCLWKLNVMVRRFPISCFY
jgi:hypothetical protein